MYFKNRLLVFSLTFLSIISLTAKAISEEVITYIYSEGDKVAIRIELPEQPRYTEGAPVVVEVGSWFVSVDKFKRVNDTKKIGAVTLSLVWPGRTDQQYNVSSEGEFDYGGPRTLKAIRDMARFATGEIPDTANIFITDYYPDALTENAGIFASSHSGVIATNAIAYHGSEFPKVKYFVGRENPTRDEMYPLEIGHWGEDGMPKQNPYYDDEDFHPKEVTFDCSTVGWYDDGQSMPRPYFAASGNKKEHILHHQICPKPYDIRYYSRAVTRALRENGALTDENWPEDLATPEETEAFWSFRTSVNNYPKIKQQLPELRVMLVFAYDDHVQTAIRKPHIHQAWEGFKQGASLWVRMNCDRSYAESIDPVKGSSCPDNDANSEPEDWIEIRDWGFRHKQVAREHIWLASVAEMADRVHYEDWSANLDVEYKPVIIRGSDVSYDMDAESALTKTYKVFSHRKMSIELILNKTSKIRYSIFDVLGNIVKSGSLGMVGPGRLKFSPATNQLPFGMYFIRFY